MFSRDDEVPVPNLTVAGNSALHTGTGAIVDVAVQTICPADTSEHLAMGTYDPVGYALAIDAFAHPGAPANPARISRSVCANLLMPGVDPATFATNFAAVGATAGREVVRYPHTLAEPPLAPYVFAQ